MQRSVPIELGTAVVIGSHGGIGAALIEALAVRARHDRIYAFSRLGSAASASGSSRVLPGCIDILDEASIAAAVGRVEGRIELVIVATGRLQGDGVSPERTYAALGLDALTRSFQLNAAGPTLVAKHVLPRLPKDSPAVFAALSARVGSIEDNRLGGWYGYRASKAALNMLVRCLAVELGRSRPLAACVALHPGTVDTALSRPFQRGVAADKLFTPADAAERLLKVLDGLSPEDSGGFYAYDGTRIPF